MGLGHMQIGVQQQEVRDLLDIASGFQRVHEQRVADAAHKAVKQV